MKAETNLQSFYKSKNPFLRWYEWRRLKKAAKLANLKGNETVVDFGCNIRALQKVLPKTCKYIGFDVVSEYSDIDDYTRLKNVDVVFALAVFEHLDEKQLRTVLGNFKKMGIKKLVVELPREEGRVSRLANGLLGLEFEHVLNHKTDWKKVVRIVDEFYDCTNVFNNMFIGWISVWEK